LGYVETSSPKKRKSLYYRKDSEATLKNSINYG